MSSYTVCMVKILQWNSQKSRYFSKYPWNAMQWGFLHLHVTFAQFLFLFLNSCLGFFFCICLACWHLFWFLLIYFWLFILCTVCLLPLHLCAHFLFGILFLCLLICVSKTILSGFPCLTSWLYIADTWVTLQFILLQVSY